LDLKTLYAENTLLRREVDGLYDHIGTISYVFNYPQSHTDIQAIYSENYDALIDKIDETKEEIKAMIEQIQTSIADANASQSPALAEDLHQKNFDTCFWNAASWRGLRSNGAKDLDLNAPILSLFMEDQAGNPISEEVRADVYDTIQSYWIDVRDDGEQVRLWKETGLRRKEDFLAKMERKFPWLKLCEGHWKTKQLWINYFGKWKKTPPNKPSPVPDNKSSQPKEKTPIEISSDDGVAPANTKRRREGEEDSQPPKRHKGKEREVAPPTFHPPRPQPKKMKAKLGKVCLITLPVTRPPLIGSRPTHCILFYSTAHIAQ
jgi:hypothetical protein